MMDRPGAGERPDHDRLTLIAFGPKPLTASASADSLQSFSNRSARFKNNRRFGAKEKTMKMIRALVSKIISSGWFTLFCIIAALWIGSAVRNRFWPEPVPAYETVNIHVDDFEGLSVQAKQTVTGVEFVWDFLKQELVIDNRYNDHPAKVQILGWDIGPSEYKPHERRAFSRRVAIGSKMGVEVEVEVPGSLSHHKTKYFVIGAPAPQTAINNN